MNVTKFFFVLVLLITSSSVINGQMVQITIVDEENTPVDYANVQVLNTSKHTHSNANGYFEFENIELGDSLLISHILFESYSIEVSESYMNQVSKITLKSKKFQLDELVIGEEYDVLKTIAYLDLASSPVSSSQEILRTVPGLIIGQHAGGGKAEQMFLRGFDVDHGTDINLSFDGMPVNMVSHAHGQGYADLHFIIPEVINQIDYGKGPYEASYGNFTTAGYVNFKSKNKLENNSFGLEVGDFNTQRLLLLSNLLNNNNPNKNGYIALEYLQSDGPFETTQAFNRINLFSKYTSTSEFGKLSISGSHFKSRWDASGQIPWRAVNSGVITRFGAIDDTEGGETSRTNISLQYNKYINSRSYIESSAYYSKYDFTLFSNFTFFLNDSINGDQIKQTEDRSIYGAKIVYNQSIYKDHFDLDFQIGAALRYDDVNNVELSNTINRTQTESINSLGNVDETNAQLYGDISFNYQNLKITAGLRLDQFTFNYQDLNQSLYENYNSKEYFVSPKFKFSYALIDETQVFVKIGRGFHSNDTRLIANSSNNKSIPAATGFDIGTVLSPIKGLILNASYWELHLDQEFVYVGDEGIVEPSGRTKRTGFDFGLRFQLKNWLYLYSDISIAKPIFKDESIENNTIPLAPTFTHTGGISIMQLNNISGGIRYRIISDRAANEDESLIATGYKIFDLNVNYTIANITFGIEINNILNTEWEETQFATLSKLQNESEPVEEIHFTPGSPRFVKGKITYMF